MSRRFIILLAFGILLSISPWYGIKASGTEESGSGADENNDDADDDASNEQVAHHVKKGARQVMHGIVKKLVTHTGDKLSKHVAEMFNDNPSKKNRVSKAKLKSELTHQQEQVDQLATSLATKKPVNSTTEVAENLKNEETRVQSINSDVNTDSLMRKPVQSIIPAEKLVGPSKTNSATLHGKPTISSVTDSPEGSETQSVQNNNNNNSNNNKPTTAVNSDMLSDTAQTQSTPVNTKPKLGITGQNTDNQDLGTVMSADTPINALKAEGEVVANSNDASDDTPDETPNATSTNDTNSDETDNNEKGKDGLMTSIGGMPLPMLKSISKPPKKSASPRIARKYHVKESDRHLIKKWHSLTKSPNLSLVVEDDLSGIVNRYDKQKTTIANSNKLTGKSNLRGMRNISNQSDAKKFKVETIELDHVRDLLTKDNKEAGVTVQPTTVDESQTDDCCGESIPTPQTVTGSTQTGSPVSRPTPMPELASNPQDNPGWGWEGPPPPGAENDPNQDEIEVEPTVPPMSSPEMSKGLYHTTEAPNSSSGAEPSTVSAELQLDNQPSVTINSPEISKPVAGPVEKPEEESDETQEEEAEETPEAALPVSKPVIIPPTEQSVPVPSEAEATKAADATLSGEVKEVKSRLTVLEEAVSDIVNRIKKVEDELLNVAPGDAAAKPDASKAKEMPLPFNLPIMSPETIAPEASAPEANQNEEGGLQMPSENGRKVIKQIFIPLPPPQSPAEEEISRGSPVPGLPFPISFIVGKLLRKMIKERQRKAESLTTEQQPRLTPGPEEDTPPTEHDINRLQMEINAKRLFGKPSAGFEGMETVNEDTPKPSLFTMMLSNKQSESPAQPGCDPPCLNGGKCVSDNVCRCSKYLSGDQCQRLRIPERLMSKWEALRAKSSKRHHRPHGNLLGGFFDNMLSGLFHFPSASSTMKRDDILDNDSNNDIEDRSIEKEIPLPIRERFYDNY